MNTNNNTNQDHESIFKITEGLIPITKTLTYQVTGILIAAGALFILFGIYHCCKDNIKDKCWRRR